MCGFAAFINSKRTISDEVLSKINKDIKHRGPDSSGLLKNDNFTFLFRRLSIIDVLKRSDQPMIDQKNKISLVFNGEIYNYLELKKELISKGFQFKTSSDTEVVLHSYKAWGIDFVKKFEGMFALVLADLKINKIIASRDHFGIKPLYYYKDKNFIYFGSEIRPLKNIIEFKVNEECLNEIIFFNFTSGKQTGLKKVEKVPAGFTYVVDINSSKVEKYNYYNVLNSFSSKNNSLRQVELLLENSIYKHTQSDVGFSVQLSGGVDSSFLVAVLYSKFGKNLKTYSLRIDDDMLDESEYRKYVHGLFPTEHHEVSFNSRKFADNFEATIRSLESPTKHCGCILLYELCRQISKKNKVVITGEGADELFGGYPRYEVINKILFLKKISKFFPLGIIRNFDKLKFLEEFKKINPYENVITFRKFDRMKSIFRGFNSQDIYSKSIFDKFKKPFDKLAAYDYLIYLESLLLRQDKVSMAHGVEARVPFVNQPLIKYLNSIPEKKRYDKKVSKFLLKKISEKFYSKKFLYRKKNGLNLPLSKWLNDSKGFGKFLDLFEGNFELQNYAEKKIIRKYIDDYKLKKDSSLAPILTQLINLEIWFRTLKN